MNSKPNTNHISDFLLQSRSINPEGSLKKLDHQLKNVNPSTLQEVKQAGTRRMIQNANSSTPPK